MAYCFDSISDLIFGNTTILLPNFAHLYVMTPRGWCSLYYQCHLTPEMGSMSLPRTVKVSCIDDTLFPTNYRFVICVAHSLYSNIDVYKFSVHDSFLSYLSRLQEDTEKSNIIQLKFGYVGQQSHCVDGETLKKYKKLDRNLIQNIGQEKMVQKNWIELFWQHVLIDTSKTCARKGKGMLKSHAMERVAASAHLPTPWLLWADV